MRLILPAMLLVSVSDLTDDAAATFTTASRRDKAVQSLWCILRCSHLPPLLPHGRKTSAEVNTGQLNLCCRGTEGMHVTQIFWADRRLVLRMSGTYAPNTRRSMTCHSTIWQVGYDNTDSCSGEPPDLKGDLSRTTFTHSPDRPPSEFSSAAAALRTRRPEDASLSGGIQTSRREVGMYHHSRDDRLRVYRKEISVSRVSPQYDCEPQVNDLCLVAVFRS